MTLEKELDAALTRLLPHAPRLGVSRLADVTGLDRVGLPVALAVRPLGRALSVNQGKGLSLPAAKLGALFEAAEQAAAEAHALPLYYGAAAERRVTHRLVDCGSLPARAGSPFNERYPILWTSAQGLLGGAEVLVPYELVHCDMSFPQPAGSGCFPLSTSGLGAGFDPEAAVRHALLECIERDQTALHELRGPAGSAIDLGSVRRPETTALLQRCAEIGLLVVALDATGDLGVPTVSCRVMEAAAETAAMVHAAEGSAARADGEEALLAALMEALQARLAFISGTRDDLHPADFEPHDRQGELRQMQALARSAASGRDLARLGNPALRTARNLTAALAERLRAAGCDEPLVVHFPSPAPGVQVARVLVPGLETALHPAHVPGPRARAILRALA